MPWWSTHALRRAMLESTRIRQRFSLAGRSVGEQMTPLGMVTNGSLVTNESPGDK